MTTFVRAKLKKSDDQTNIKKKRAGERGWEEKRECERDRTD